jgi:hypothetical protein
MYFGSAQPRETECSPKSQQGKINLRGNSMSAETAQVLGKNMGVNSS